MPRRLSDVDTAELRNTFAPKVGGLEAVLAAVDTDRLRLLVTFGSVIGRGGLAGEAHYAAANAALTEVTERFGREHPHCRCLTLEWSVWASVGMGDRLGVVDSLRHNGITPIETGPGLGLLRNVLASDTPGTLVVTGAELSTADGLYLEDHNVDGNLLCRWWAILGLNPGRSAYACTVAPPSTQT